MWKVKEKWEKELSINISGEAWRESLKENFESTQSKHWREFAWKISLRFFITPHIIGKTSTVAGSGCWRGCGASKANHAHIFFTCPVIKSFWEEAEDAIKDILDIKESLTFENWLGINMHHKTKLKERKVFKAPHTLPRRPTALSDRCPTTLLPLV